MKIRTFPESNYRGIFHDGKTMRIALDPSKPITELEYPEFYDVKITGQCYGDCPYCYQDSSHNGKQYDVLDNIDAFFGTMTENQRPFQVAIGGGEPTLHSHLELILKKFHSLGISPNYTTNGMHTNTYICKETKKYCDGIAITCHRHLENHWKNSLAMYNAFDIMVNLHILISDRESVDYFKEIYTDYYDKVSYFVLLPYIVKGRAFPVEDASDYLFEWLPANDNIAFGANYYNRLKIEGERFRVSLYEPEILSKYLDMKDMKLYNSSFE